MMHNATKPTTNYCPLQHLAGPCRNYKKQKTSKPITLLGDTSNGKVLSSYDVVRNSWNSVPLSNSEAMPAADGKYAIIQAPSGHLLIHGGINSSGKVINSFTAVDPNNGTSTLISPTAEG